MLLWLAFEDPDPVVRAGARVNPKRHCHHRRARSGTRDRSREAAVMRVGFPVDLLAAAARDSSARVRLAALTHDPLDPAISGRLSRDVDAVVRAAACRHADCPATALAVAMEDHDVSVRRAAVERPSLP